MENPDCAVPLHSVIGVGWGVWTSDPFRRTEPFYSPLLVGTVNCRQVWWETGDFWTRLLAAGGKSRIVAVMDVLSSVNGGNQKDKKMLDKRGKYSFYGIKPEWESRRERLR